MGAVSQQHADDDWMKLNLLYKNMRGSCLGYNISIIKAVLFITVTAPVPVTAALKPGVPVSGLYLLLWETA